MRKFSASYELEQSVDDVFKAFTKKKALTKMYEAAGSRNIEIETDKQKNGVNISVRREVPADPPAALKKIASDYTKIKQEQVWTGSKGGPYTGKMVMQTLGGVKAQVSTVFELSDSGDGCDVDMETEVKCTMPLVGKQIEKFMEKDGEENIDADVEYIAENA